ncbi:leucine-rich repeat domain-containing protein [Coleofasciculus sp. FACHB-64]|uniref:leucine-rich repeat domain-containing protein n=1 Tax=Cyanophyceae TaxID=3028117 RepID=UPI001F54E1B7|nr:leucine-rich repeat domain-containing protein [Coleofasciculus sp. FACHB-64]
MSESQPNPTPNFNNFVDLCLHEESLSKSARAIVKELLHQAGTSDCYEAERILSKRTELNPRLSEHNINDLSPLSGLTNITQLYLHYNQITELSPLSGLTNLTRLELNGNRIYDLSPLSGLTNLTQLYLRSNQITELSPLSGLTNLTYLELNNNRINDLSLLSELTNLTHLGLVNTQINDLSPLSRLTNLTELSLDGNQITELSPLSRLTNLIRLYLSGNQITDLSPLSELTNLTELSLGGNRITDLSPLSRLTNLIWLYLSGNQITELSGLSGLTNLIHLDLKANPIVNQSLLPLLQKRRTLLTKPIDFQEAKKAIKSAYATIGKEEPEVLFCCSPHAARTQLFNLLKLDNTPEKQKSGTTKSLIVLGESLLKPLRGIVKGFPCQGVWLHIRHTIAPQQIPLEPTAGEKEARKYREIIRRQFPSLISKINSYFEEYFYPVTPTELFEEIYATEFYVSSLGVTLDQKTQEAFDCLNQLFEHCGWIFPYEKVCLVCDRPTKILLDNQNRLHAEGEAVIQFADGWHTEYYYHGVKLPEKYGKLHPDQWQVQWLLEEDNAELRRVLIQGIGYARICQELQATELDSWQEYTLLKFDAYIDGFQADDSEDDEKEPIHLLKMACPSTGFIHAMRVPPDITSARAAIRWINWDIDPEEFSVQT